MDCNREEANRAKDIAERKMQNNDFVGARKLALKAQLLFPELDNISQLLAVCDVHCSAQNKIFGSDKDWYGILQVERLADEATIKKQYRKLALVLHPDKNKFPGAEAAFKLIGEANRLLSDKGKRSMYDLKWKISVKTTERRPPHQPSNQNASSEKEYSGPSNKPNYSSCPSNKPSYSCGQSNKPSDFIHQQTHEGFPDGRAFWTCCPFCNIKYQYYRKFVNRALLCQKCSKPFIAYDMGVKGVPSGFNSGQFKTQTVPPGSFQAQPASSKQTPFMDQRSSKVGAQGTGGSPAEVSEGLNTDFKDSGHGKVVNEKENIGVCKVNGAMDGKSGTSRNLNRKRRKTVVESSDSCDTSSSGDTKVTSMEENGGNPATGEMAGLNGHYVRRSSRQRQSVSYKECEINDDDFVSAPTNSRSQNASYKGSEIDDDDFVSAPTNSRSQNASYNESETDDDDFVHVPTKSRGSEQTTVKNEEALRNAQSENGGGAGLSGDPASDEGKIKHQSVAPQGSLPDMNNEAEKPEGDGGVANKEAETFEVADDMLSDTDFAEASEPELYDCADPEFNNFDQHREEYCFNVNQLWACYDTADCMPRFYAQVKKVFSPGFKLEITWLETNPEAQDEKKWVKADLPMACGRFKLGFSELTTDRLAFSHQVGWEKGKRGSYMVYPRSGETWALFKDWDIGWSSEPEKHRKYEFEIVEVLSDFVGDAGIRVSYLRKVKGFVSLFQRTSEYESPSVLIPTRELLRFSHRIPSFRMTGREREGVPAGCFELDPACLPSNLTECCQDDEVKREFRSTEAEVQAFVSKSPSKEEFLMGSQRTSTPKISPLSEQKNNVQGQMAKLRRSPRELNSKNTKFKPVDANQCSSPDGTSKFLNGSTNKEYGEFMPTRGSTSSCQFDEDMNFKKCSVPLNSSVVGEGSEEMFYDFNQNRSEKKFKIGQIWALYKDGLPKIYVQVKKIESFPFRLHVAFLESGELLKDQMQPASCGTFRVQSGKARVFSVSLFSHLVLAVPLGRNRFEIYPRKGEIWALLHKDWHADMLHLQNGDYNIVEILEENEQWIEVSTLDRLSGYKSVFKTTSRRQRSSAGIMEILRGEVSRFSHQIPAFRLTGENIGRLGDCWELDPASIPGNCSLI